MGAHSTEAHGHSGWVATHGGILGGYPWHYGWLPCAHEGGDPWH